MGDIFSTTERLERPTWQWQVLRLPHGLRTGLILEKNAWGWCWNRKKIGCQSQAHSGYLRVVRAIKNDSGAILRGSPTKARAHPIRKWLMSVSFRPLSSLSTITPFLDAHARRTTSRVILG